MGLFGGVGSLSDDELESRYEALRLKYVSTTDITEADNLRSAMDVLDEEMTRRANERYLAENPDAHTRHREHGWYL